MASKTKNYNLTKPSSEDFYDIGVQNDNMDIIDGQLKILNDKAKADGELLKSLQDADALISMIAVDTENNLKKHLTESNPHEITASKIGLGNVPNVSTNDQTPTYTEASALTNLTSGEKLSVVLGKVKKAITDLISHLADTTKHITSTERTKWNAHDTAIADAKSAGTTAQTNLNSHTSNKSNPHGVTSSQIGAAPTSHASTAKTYGVGTSTNYGHLKITDSKTSTETDTAASAKALKETYEIADGAGSKLLKSQVLNIQTIKESSSMKSAEFTISGVDFTKYREIDIVLDGTFTMIATGNAASAHFEVYFGAFTGNRNKIFDMYTTAYTPKTYTEKVTLHQKIKYGAKVIEKDITESIPEIIKQYNYLMETSNGHITNIDAPNWFSFQTNDENHTFTFSGNLYVYGRGAI